MITTTNQGHDTEAQVEGLLSKWILQTIYGLVLEFPVHYLVFRELMRLFFGLQTMKARRNSKHTQHFCSMIWDNVLDKAVEKISRKNATH